MSTDRIRWRGNICGAVIGSRLPSLFIFCDWALSHEHTYITCLYHLQPRPAVIKKGFWKTLNQSSSRGMKVAVLVEGGSEDEGVVYVWVFCFIRIGVLVAGCWIWPKTKSSLKVFVLNSPIFASPSFRSEPPSIRRFPTDTVTGCNQWPGCNQRSPNSITSSIICWQVFVLELIQG